MSGYCGQGFTLQSDMTITEWGIFLYAMVSLCQEVSLTGYVTSIECQDVTSNCHYMTTFYCHDNYVIIMLRCIIIM